MISSGFLAEIKVSRKNPQLLMLLRVPVVANNTTLLSELPFADANFWGSKFRADLRKYHHSIKYRDKVVSLSFSISVGFPGTSRG